MSDAHAFILAGGKGRRLGRLTSIIPKPLVPVGDRSILELLLSQLAEAGITDVTISLGHLGHLIEAVIGDGAALGVNVTYTREESPLGTAGALSLLPPLGDETDILVINGDTYTDLRFQDLLAEHRSFGAMATIATFENKHRSEFGVMVLGPEGDLLEYHEKPETTELVSIGVNVLKADALNAMEHGEYLDMPTLLLRLRDQGSRVRCARLPCRWIDLGRIEDVYAANEELLGAPSPEEHGSESSE